MLKASQMRQNCDIFTLDRKRWGLYIYTMPIYKMYTYYTYASRHIIFLIYSYRYIEHIFISSVHSIIYGIHYIYCIIHNTPCVQYNMQCMCTYTFRMSYTIARILYHLRIYYIHSIIYHTLCILIYICTG